jgi:hypothetical protein
LYFNYKKSFSVVLLALCDHEYRLTAVDLGSAGHNSDAGIFKRCELGRRIMDDDLDFPPNKLIPGFAAGGFVPHVIVGDAAFPLRENIMIPYGKPSSGNLTREQRIFNYRLSRARGKAEQLFGLMVQRWRLLYNGRIKLTPESLIPILQAILVLHNLVQKRGGKLPPGCSNPFKEEFKPEEKEWLLQNIPKKGGKPAEEPVRIRKVFTEYFNYLGSISWQDRSAFLLPE